MKLSPISLAVLPLLTVFSATAAVYQVAELEPNNISKATFAASLNDNGDTVVSGQGFVADFDLRGNRISVVNYLNFPLDVETYNFENQSVVNSLTAEQIEDAKQGIYSASILDFLTRVLAENQSIYNQPVGQALAISQLTNSTPAVLPLRDLNQLRSNSEFVYDMTNQGVVVGIATAPYSKQQFTKTVSGDAEQPEAETVWQPEPGFVYGVAVTPNGPVNLLPPYTDFGGGFSKAVSVNDTNLIAGSGSVGLDQSFISQLEATCNGNNEPVVTCLNGFHQSSVYSYSTLQNEIKLRQTVASFINGYQERAVLWQVEADGTATVKQTFGYLGEKNTGEKVTPDSNFPDVFYYSMANAVNNSGVAVGHSMYSDKDRVIRFRDQRTGQEIRRIYAAPHASLYRDGEVSALVDVSEWLASNAIDINNNNVVTGHAIKFVNGVARDKFFYYDLAANSATFPSDFFAGSSSIPSDINDNGQIVGRAEVIIGGTTTRRLHGFVYDIASNTFSDLNTLLGCNSSLTVVDASAINNNGEILATVLESQPRLDAKGEPLLDDSGNPIMAEQARAVKLLPIANGQVESCNTEQNSYQRQAGGFNGLGLLLLAGFGLFFRRRR